MTKEDYLKLVDEKGQQNKMMSRKAQDSMLMMHKEQEKDTAPMEISQDLGVSQKTQFAKTRFEKSDGVRLKKN